MLIAAIDAKRLLAYISGCGCNGLVTMTTLSWYDCYQPASSYIGFEAQLSLAHHLHQHGEKLS